MQGTSRRRRVGWQVAALAGAGSVGALALLNRLASAGAGEARSVLDGEHGRYAWTQGDIFYAVKGRGEPLVLVHGIYAGASSFEYRRVFDLLSRHFRVYAFDLLGFGLSDRPPVTYTPELYANLLQDFVRQVCGGADHPVRVVASSLGAAFTIRTASARPNLFARLVLVEPTGIEDLAVGGENPQRRAGRWLLRTPLVGQALYNGIAARPSIRYFLRQSYARSVELSDDLIDYYYTMAHQPGARYAPASFVSGTLNTPVLEAYASLRMPLLLLWGKSARFTPLERARAFRLANPRAELRVYDCGSLPQEEVPGEFVRDVTAWLGARVRPSHGEGRS